MVSYLMDKSKLQGRIKRVKGLRPLRGSRGGVSPWQGTGTASLLRAAAPINTRLSRIPRIRETAHAASKKQITLSMPTPQGSSTKPPSRGRWHPLSRLMEEVPTSAWSIDPLFLVLCAASSFSTLRKKQRGPEGVPEFPPSTVTPSGLPPPLHARRHVELYSFAYASRGRADPCLFLCLLVRRSPSASRRCRILPFFVELHVIVILDFLGERSRQRRRRGSLHKGFSLHGDDEKCNYSSICIISFWRTSF